MKQISLRTRLLLVAVVPLLVVALLSVGVLLDRYVRDIEDAHAARSQALATQMQAATGFALFVGDREQLYALANGLLESDPLAHGVWIRDARGEVIVRAERADLQAAGTAKTRWYTLPIRAGVTADEMFLGEVEDAAQTPPTLGQIDVQYDDAPIRRQVWSLLQLAALVVVLAVVTGVALALTLARRVSLPVLAVSQAVQRISSGDLRARAESPPTGVLDDLIAGINTMAQNLEMAQDILRWRIAEATAELRGQRDAAERATQAKSRFLTAASHDLRQPLQALALFAFQLRQQVPQGPAQGLIANVESAVLSLQQMFGTLLDLSRIDAHGVPVQASIFAPGETMAALCRQMSPVAEARGIQLCCRAETVRVHADPSLVERILLNLLSNALKYTEHGRVTVRCRVRGNRVRLAVSDTGIGIPLERQADIFGEFVQVGNEERDPDKGLGIGLSICREMAHALGTSVQLRSRPGRGSVFWFDLPLAVPEEAAAADSEPRPLLLRPPVYVYVEESNIAEPVVAQLDQWQFPRREGPPTPSEVAGGGILLCDVAASQRNDVATLCKTLANDADWLLVLLTERGERPASDSPWAAVNAQCLDRTAPPGRLRAVLSAWAPGRRLSVAD
jgi:signal transduction histidine kinase